MIWTHMENKEVNMMCSIEIWLQAGWDVIWSTNKKGGEVFVSDRWCRRRYITENNISALRTLNLHTSVYVCIIGEFIPSTFPCGLRRQRLTRILYIQMNSEGQVSDFCSAFNANCRVLLRMDDRMSPGRLPQADVVVRRGLSCFSIYTSDFQSNSGMWR